MTTQPLCGSPHHQHPETLCTHPAGHYRRERDPHAGQLIIDGRVCGSAVWDEPDRQDQPMTDRVPLDHLTSDQYDALCDQLDALRAVARGYCPQCGRRDAAPTTADWEAERQRADEAEQRLRNIANGLPRADSIQAEIGEMILQTHELRDQLRAAEAALDRVRAAAAKLAAAQHGIDVEADSIRRAAAREVLAALDGEQPAVPDDTDTDTTEPAPASLRNQVARALEREDALHWGYDHGFADTYGADPETDGFVDAVLAVRDREMQRLAAARDELAGVLAAVLSAFPADLNPGGPAVHSRHVPAELVARWRAALDQRGPAAIQATELATSPLREQLAADIAEPEPGAVVDRQTAAVLAALHRSAEDTVTRVIDLYERWVKTGAPPLGTSINRWWDKRLVELNAVLGQEPGTHVYMSTGCWHGDHDYCKSMTGLNGAKRPGECKHCGAKCICGCHAAPETPGPA